jgi:hypothetical protein
MRKIFYGSVIVFVFLLFFIILSQKPSFISAWTGEENFPDHAAWYGSLPSCPCNYTEVQQLDETIAPQGKWLDCGEASQTYHYGATFEVRWVPAADGQPGQQCTYDEKGALITEGMAAGSPDKVSPQSCGFSISILWHLGSLLQHKKADVDPWKEAPCTTYLTQWPANNANHCQPNPVTPVAHMQPLVKDMSCEAVTALFRVVDQYDSTRTLYAYFHNPSATPPPHLKELMVALQERADCNHSNNNACRALQQVLNNLEE